MTAQRLRAAVENYREKMEHPCAVYDAPFEEIEEMAAAIEEELEAMK